MNLVNALLKPLIKPNSSINYIHPYSNHPRCTKMSLIDKIGKRILN